jgi:uncharacterized membrane protein
VLIFIIKALRSNLSKYLLCCFIYGAAFAHIIWATEFTLLIPPYIPAKEIVNSIVIALEILVSTGLLIVSLQHYSAVGILALLLVFIPSHIYVIQEGGCIQNSLCVSLWIAWVRLIVIHPFLLLWAFTFTEYGEKYFRNRITTV